MSQRDDDALEVLREAAALPPASPFATARAARALEAALDDDQRDQRARGRWTSARVAAVALVAAASTGALALVIGDVLRPAPLALAPIEAATQAAIQTAPQTALVAAAPARAPLVIEEPEVAPVVEPVKRVRRTPAEEAARLTEAGDAVAGARVLVRSLGKSPDSFASLALLARRFPDAITAIDEELAAVPTTDAMRLRCQHRLLHVRDVTAMVACRAFGQEHPQDPAARVLSFAAGRLAEDLGDLAWAEEEYSRSLLLSPFSGLSGTDALLARARVRFAAGDVGEARADLRLYLHSEPSARRDAAVDALASALGL